MKYRILLTLLLIGNLSFAQTDKHIKILGTKCSIIPPNGFMATNAFSGFQSSETGASIMINELPAPYQQLVDGFTAEALKTRGMTLISKQTIDLNKSKATYIKVSQPANGTIYLKQILIFGDPKETVLVNGIYPESSKGIEPQIMEALLSTVYDSSEDDNPLEAASFSIDTKDTDFKLNKYMSGSLLYSTDGKVPTEKPTLIVGNSIAKVSSQNRKKYSEERIKKLPRGEQNNIREIREITVDGLNGYEIVADGKTKDNKPELVYQVMLFNESGDYYIIVGQAAAEFDRYIAIFKKVTKTFKRK